MLIDTDQKYVSRIEAGKAKARISVYLRIANAFQVSIDDLLLGAIEDGTNSITAHETSTSVRFGRAEQELMNMLQNAVYQYLQNKE